MSENQIFDVVIIGAGPSGYTAAIYIGRAQLKTLVIQGWQPGGQLTTTTVIENFPGFRDGIDGKKLMEEMKAQAERFGAQFVMADILKADFSKRPFTITAGDKEYVGKSVIIATGSKSRTLGIPSEKKLWAKGVSTCATCDGFFFRGKTVAILGGGDSAMEEANFLTKFANKVYIIHRNEAFRASKIMLDRAKANPKIEMIMNTTVEEVLGDTKVTGLRLKDNKTGKTSELIVDGMFLAIGHVPVTDLFKGQIKLDQLGFIKHAVNTMTSVEGIFAAGDCVDHRYRQAITAAGMGCQAAIDANRWLAERQ